MRAVIESYLQARHPSVRIWEEPAGVYHLHLSEELRREIHLASSREVLWLERSRKGVFSFCFDGVRAYDHPEADLINVSHPFLKAAVAASMAVPGFVQPLEVGGRVLIDGGVTDPLPFGCLRGKADVIVAVDVSGSAERAGVPDPWDSLFSAISVMGHTIVSHKLKEGAPDLVLRPNIGIFRMLDFLQASAILRAAEPIKTEVREKLGALL